MKETIFNKIKKSKTNLFIGLAICCLILVIVLDLFDSNFSYHDILVESHGLVFDLFIFGILLTIYETVNHRKEQIERYKEEISDYKFWKSEESMYRTRGLIKRLVDLGEKNLDLSFCYLATDKSFGQYKDMTNWNFTGAVLNDSFFCVSDMTNSNFYFANLQESRFDNVNLTNAQFDSTNLIDSKFLNCDLTNTNFDNAAINNINWFNRLESEKNIGVDILRKKYCIQETENSNGYKYFKIVKI